LPCSGDSSVNFGRTRDRDASLEREPPFLAERFRRASLARNTGDWLRSLDVQPLAFERRGELFVCLEALLVEACLARERARV